MSYFFSSIPYQSEVKKPVEFCGSNGGVKPTIIDASIYMINITELAQCAPAINITITAADLKDFATQLIAETKAELEQSISDSKAETYLSGEKVMEMLEISKTTLWRWKQRGYLVPVRIGGNDRYKSSDINHILQKGGRHV